MLQGYSKLDTLYNSSLSHRTRIFNHNRRQECVAKVQDRLLDSRPPNPGGGPPSSSRTDAPGNIASITRTSTYHHDLRVSIGYGFMPGGAQTGTGVAWTDLTRLQLSGSKAHPNSSSPNSNSNTFPAAEPIDRRHGWDWHISVNSCG